jgi:hypothetical protein
MTVLINEIIPENQTGKAQGLPTFSVARMPSLNNDRHITLPSHLCSTQACIDVQGTISLIHTMIFSKTSKKDRLSTGPYCLPLQQELVVPVAIANTM